jgi:endonuclease IV
LLGLRALRRFVTDPRLARLPMVVENPGPMPEWKAEIALLRGPAARPARGGAVPAVGRRP